MRGSIAAWHLVAMVCCSQACRPADPADLPANGMFSCFPPGGDSMVLMPVLMLVLMLAGLLQVSQLGNSIPCP